jgi:hypothetical protein
LNKIARLISERQIGIFLQADTGMDWVKIVIEVEEKDGARKEIVKIINAISPVANFSFHYIKS